MNRPREFSEGRPAISRREFHAQVSRLAAGFLFGQDSTNSASLLVLVKGDDRSASLRRVLELSEPVDFDGKDIYLKASYNSADEFPASTHPETLRIVASYLREKNCRRIILLERSGMGITRDVWNHLGIPDIAKRTEITLLPLEEIPPQDWRLEYREGWHWKRGVEVPRFLNQEAVVVQICNLRTHRFGGHFSASLKNSIGLVAKYSPGESRYNYMAELHASADQRAMIAEVNQIYTPALVIVDAMQVFVDGGPDRGDLAHPHVIAASRDRVAVDAVGVALLRLHGAGPPLKSGGPFDQDQLKRAVELGLGSRSENEIKFLAPDDASQKAVTQTTALLKQTVEDQKR